MADESSEKKPKLESKPGVVVHGAGTAFEHTHGPSGAKICGLGCVTLGGATFMVDRDGQVEAGATTEFGIEHIGGAPGVEPSGAWIANPDGKKLCEPVVGEGHAPVPGEDPHWHFNLTPLYPVKKAALVLAVGEETAVVDFKAGAAPHHHGILNVFKELGFLELTLHGDAGDLELRLYSSAGERTPWQAATGVPKPFDIPAETVVTVSFPSHEGKTVELRPRNLEKNEDEDGTPNMRDGNTNYFIFPGDTGQDPEWLKGLEWRGRAVVAFEANGKAYEAEPFVLVPHEAL